MKVVENQIQKGNHLSHSNNIKSLLDIHNKNIETEKNAVELRSHQGRMAKFFTAKLTYTPAYYDCCGVKNEDYTIYKNGTKTSRIINITRYLANASRQV